MNYQEVAAMAVIWQLNCILKYNDMKIPFELFFKGKWHYKKDTCSVNHGQQRKMEKFGV